ncbi:MAG: hypothetical protein HZC37_28985 [Burkholderiales bacterium]|nr:hypothetical protein [Burkholderiales bacterium]
MLKRRTLIAMALAAASGACSSPPAAAAGGHLVQVQIVDRAGGDLLPEVRQRGTHWVAGRPGERYAVRLANRSGARVLVVLSVDGINAVSGQTAATSQTGYVLAPWQTADITGWRKTDAEAAAFYFTALPDSYAARTDRPHNVGVIGVAVFRERVPVPRPVPLEVAPSSGSSGSRQDSAERRAQAGADGADKPARGPAEAGSADRGAAMGAAAAPAAPAPAVTARAERLGTGHGEREYSPISRTSFERASSSPAEIVQIRYDSHANLVAAGILPGPRAPYGIPEPFPGGYVPDPR